MLTTIEPGTHNRCGLRFKSLGILFTALMLGCPLRLAAQQQRVFSSPGEAASALFAAAKADDTAALAAILGPDSQQLLSSGDPVADKNARAQFSSEWDQMHRLAFDDQGRVIIYLGSDNWPAPIPIVKKGDGWVFDTAAGKDELIYRRIGRNELYTIGILENLVDAQEEYASESHDGVKQYARLSTPEQKYITWPEQKCITYRQGRGAAGFGQGERLPPRRCVELAG